MFALHITQAEQVILRAMELGLFSVSGLTCLVFYGIVLGRVIFKTKVRTAVSLAVVLGMLGAIGYKIGSTSTGNGTAAASEDVRQELIQNAFAKALESPWKEYEQGKISKEELLGKIESWITNNNKLSEKERVNLNRQLEDYFRGIESPKINTKTNSLPIIIALADSSAWVNGWHVAIILAVLLLAGALIWYLHHRSVKAKAAAAPAVPAAPAKTNLKQYARNIICITLHIAFLAVFIIAFGQIWELLRAAEASAMHLGLMLSLSTIAAAGIMAGIALLKNDIDNWRQKRPVSLFYSAGRLDKKEKLVLRSAHQDFYHPEHNNILGIFIKSPISTIISLIVFMVLGILSTPFSWMVVLKFAALGLFLRYLALVLWNFFWDYTWRYLKFVDFVRDYKAGRLNGELTIEGVKITVVDRIAQEMDRYEQELANGHSYAFRSAATGFMLRMPITAGILRFAISRGLMVLMSSVVANVVLMLLGLPVVSPDMLWGFPHTLSEVVRLTTIVIGLKLLGIKSLRNELQDIKAQNEFEKATKAAKDRNLTIDVRRLLDRIDNRDPNLDPDVVRYLLSKGIINVNGRSGLLKILEDQVGVKAVKISFKDWLRYSVAPYAVALLFTLAGPLEFLGYLGYVLAHPQDAFTSYYAGSPYYEKVRRDVAANGNPYRALALREGGRFWTSFWYMSIIGVEINSVLASGSFLAHYHSGIGPFDSAVNFMGGHLDAAGKALESHYGAIAWGQHGLMLVENALGVHITDVALGLVGYKEKDTGKKEPPLPLSEEARIKRELGITPAPDAAQKDKQVRALAAKAELAKLQEQLNNLRQAQSKDGQALKNLLQQKARIEEQLKKLDSVAQPVAPFITYTVKEGDTLWSIAQSQLGSGIKWEEIYAANRTVIGDNPDLIIPGQELSIRTRTPMAAVEAAKAHEKPGKANEEIAYYIRSLTSDSRQVGLLEVELSNARRELEALQRVAVSKTSPRIAELENLIVDLNKAYEGYKECVEDGEAQLRALSASEAVQRELPAKAGSAVAAVIPSPDPVPAKATPPAQRQTAVLVEQLKKQLTVVEAQIAEITQLQDKIARAIKELEAKVKALNELTPTTGLAPPSAHPATATRSGIQEALRQGLEAKKWQDLAKKYLALNETLGRFATAGDLDFSRGPQTIFVERQGRKYAVVAVPADAQGPALIYRNGKLVNSSLFKYQDLNEAAYDLSKNQITPEQYQRLAPQYLAYNAELLARIEDFVIELKKKDPQARVVITGAVQSLSYAYRRLLREPDASHDSEHARFVKVKAEGVDGELYISFCNAFDIRFYQQNGAIENQKLYPSLNSFFGKNAALGIYVDHAHIDGRYSDRPIRWGGVPAQDLNNPNIYGAELSSRVQALLTAIGKGIAHYETGRSRLGIVNPLKRFLAYINLAEHSGPYQASDDLARKYLIEVQKMKESSIKAKDIQQAKVTEKFIEWEIMRSISLWRGLFTDIGMNNLPFTSEQIVLLAASTDHPYTPVKMERAVMYHLIFWVAEKYNIADREIMDSLSAYRLLTKVAQEALGMDEKKVEELALRHYFLLPGAKYEITYINPTTKQRESFNITGTKDNSVLEALRSHLGEKVQLPDSAQVRLRQSLTDRAKTLWRSMRARKMPDFNGQEVTEVVKRKNSYGKWDYRAKDFRIIGLNSELGQRLIAEIGGAQNLVPTPLEVNRFDPYRILQPFNWGANIAEQMKRDGLLGGKRFNPALTEFVALNTLPSASVIGLALRAPTKAELPASGTIPPVPSAALARMEKEKQDVRKELTERDNLFSEGMARIKAFIKKTLDAIKELKEEKQRLDKLAETPLTLEEKIRRAVLWTETPGDPLEGNTAYTYSQALRIILAELTHNPELQQRAGKVIEFYYQKWQEAKKKGKEFNGFAEGYNALTEKAARNRAHRGSDAFFGLAILHHINAHPELKTRLMPMAADLANYLLRNRDTRDGLVMFDDHNYLKGTENNLVIYDFLRELSRVLPVYQECTAALLQSIMTKCVAERKGVKYFVRGINKDLGQDTVLAPDVQSWAVAIIGKDALSARGIDTKKLLDFTRDQCRAIDEYAFNDSTKVKVEGVDYIESSEWEGLNRKGMVSVEWTAQLALAKPR
ncbi:MAG: LysM peptidoglycan-binding domain-containing protein [Candidatus Omnitrophica bacterium]|nr:LysM peptidoglycan-binding domain-containing protein [Candidatus Omnitrophota bacterium]